MDFCPFMSNIDISVDCDKDCALFDNGCAFNRIANYIKQISGNNDEETDDYDD